MSDAKRLLDFFAASPTAMHAVAWAADELTRAGFTRLREEDGWQPLPGDAFFVTRGNSSLLAGRVGTKAPADRGFRIAGAHTDVPGLRLMPNPTVEKEGYLQLGVEVYGGPILATWTDRDLTLAGRVIVRGNDGLVERAVHVKRPVCRIPNLAIHFNRKVNDDGLKLDKQKHMRPLLALGDKKRLETDPLRQLLAAELGVEPAAIVDHRLEVVDAQPPALGGLDEQLLFTRGVDNLLSCYCAVRALTALPADPAIGALIVLFDNEECGSNTARGAGSTFLDVALERLTGEREALHRAIARSLLVSVDGAHAVHPNYADMHEPQHKPALGGGPVIKINANERYATSLATQTYLEQCGAVARVSVQRFVQRADLPCGTTIGPISATRLGLATVDVGAPMLSMHSIRETMHVDDAASMTDLLSAHLGGSIDPVR
ncbi:MAG TPA: M18 family aminopeptidase [bacterium]|nr:M18 family aminopeptidase [bacterium]